MRFGLPVALLWALTGILPLWGDEPVVPGATDSFTTRLAAAGQRYNPQIRAHQTNYPLAVLVSRQLELLHSWGAMGLFGRDMATSLERTGRLALERMDSYKSHFATPGELSELAYLTANDGTAQPYHLYLPPDYTPRDRWPLIIFLHGYVPTISVLDPWLPSLAQCAVAGDHGCLMAVPYARRNTDFQGVGEVDVLAVLDEVQHLYAVDPDRIYLTGVSMGGMGTWTIGLRYPDRFAALTPICGQTDMFRWWGWPRQQLPDWKRWLIEWDNAVDLAPNLTGQQVFVQHGELDELIPAEQSRLMVELGRQQGTPMRYHEFTGQGHGIYWGLEVFENAWSWAKNQRLQHQPTEVRLKCYSLEYNRAHWLTIEQLEQWGQPGEVTATVSPGGQGLQITSRNVRQLKIDVAAAPLVIMEDYPVQVNGRREVCRATAANDLYINPAPPLEAPAWPPLKRRGLCGPAEEVFDTRFLVVQGTAGDSADDTLLARQVAQWCAQWDDFADGLPPVKTDTEVTPAEVREANLILFGTPQTNSILARLADRLPVQIADHRYTIAGQTYEGPDLGLVLCYPNPLAPDRYVLIYSGETYGERLSINHKHDLLPDFLIFTTRAFDRDDANQWLCAGFFDSDWQLKPALTWQQTPAW